MGNVLQSSKYFYGLDILRATMMLLGIFIHAALLVNFYDSDFKSNYGRDILISNIIYFFSLFRMECFFILSGFLGAFIIELKSKKYFVKSRFERVFLPLIFGMFFSNVVLDVYILGLSEFSFSLSFLLKHLWFLLCLLIVSIFFLSDKFELIYDRYFKELNLLSFLIFSLFFLFIKLCFLILNSKISDNLFSEFITYMVAVPFEFFYYYFLGYMIFRGNKILDIFYTKQALLLLVPILLFSIYMFNMKYIESIDLSSIVQLLKTSSDFFVGLIISVAVFEYFKRLSYQSKQIKFLVESSLIVYIFHFPFIFLYGRLLDGVYNSVYIYYLSVCAYTFITCIFIYLFLSLFRVTRYMFGIKSNSNKKNSISLDS